jgi:hypothetical protein
VTGRGGEGRKWGWRQLLTFHQSMIAPCCSRADSDCYMRGYVQDKCGCVVLLLQAASVLRVLAAHALLLLLPLLRVCLAGRISGGPMRRAMMTGHARRASPAQVQEQQQASGGDRLASVQLLLHLRLRDGVGASSVLPAVPWQLYAICGRSQQRCTPGSCVYRAWRLA